MSQAQRVRRSPVISGLATLLNAFEGAARALGVPLDRISEEDVLRAAQRKIGLSDFGDDGFRIPLQALIRAHNEDRSVTSTGRFVMRLVISRALVNRLLIANELKRHPEIRSLPIRRPIIIASLPRTGTTFLHKLLAQDPHARPLLGWEALAPVPKRLPDNRLKRAQRHARLRRLLVPGLRTMHAYEPDGAEECIPLLRNTFVLPLRQSRVYHEWYVRQPAEVIEAAYREYRQQLQILQWQRPSQGHWVLKSPAHSYAIRALLAVFPDVAIVLTHRDPHRMIASLCSFSNVRAAFSGVSGSSSITSFVVEFATEALRRVEDARTHAEPSRIYDLLYQDLVSDPLGAVQRLYAHFGYPYTPEFERRATAWLREHPQDRYGRHRYSLEEFGLDRRMIADRFSWYSERYHIPPESAIVSDTQEFRP